MIDPDVRTVAKRFGLPPAFLQAIVRAEGDILKAVQCSLPHVRDREEALEITARSAVHRLCDFTIQHQYWNDYIAYFGSIWAPKGAENDPTGLNRNWAGNVQRIFRQLWRQDTA